MKLPTARPSTRIRVASRHGVFVHTDAAQPVGKIPVDVEARAGVAVIDPQLNYTSPEHARP